MTESPLRDRADRRLVDVRLGTVLEMAPVVDLSDRLGAALVAATARLPVELAAPAGELLRVYAGASRPEDFVRLFPVPVWSFLHWARAGACEGEDGAAWDALEQAHALSLLIHLLDDHLLDGQLSVDMLGLQLRTVAWQSMDHFARRAAEAWGVPESLVAGHLDRYVRAVTPTGPVQGLDHYLEVFTAQAAIWLLVPHLLEEAGRAAPGISDRVRDFVVAWRLIDDVEDAVEDAASGTRGALWWALDARGREAWDAYGRESRAGGRAEERAWRSLVGAVDASGAAARLVDDADALLQRASATANAAGHHGWTTEVQCVRMGLGREPVFPLPD
ncbi:hypothetical protein [Streptomyces sp. NPDC001678]|uniref:hypothetical protein n=1 Tax=Streptomyces sp. NPDC001678 TaxID=3364599 RepID=UPI0036C16C02